MKRVALLAFLLFLIPIASADIIINEVMPWPEQNDNYNEWIELHNDGSQDVDLSNYTICGKGLLAGYVDHTNAQTKDSNGF